MMKKTWEVRSGDREGLLDLDARGEAHTTDGYGSLQNGDFFPLRCVSTFLFSFYFSHIIAYCTAHPTCGQYVALFLCLIFLHFTNFTRLAGNLDLQSLLLEILMRTQEVACGLNDCAVYSVYVCYHAESTGTAFCLHVSGLITAECRLLWCSVLHKSVGFNLIQRQGSVRQQSLRLVIFESQNNSFPL